MAVVLVLVSETGRLENGDFVRGAKSPLGKPMLDRPVCVVELALACVGRAAWRGRWTCRLASGCSSRLLLAWRSSLLITRRSYAVVVAVAHSLSASSSPVVTAGPGPSAGCGVLRRAASVGAARVLGVALACVCAGVLHRHAGGGRCRGRHRGAGFLLRRAGAGARLGVGDSSELRPLQGRRRPAAGRPHRCGSGAR